MWDIELRCRYCNKAISLLRRLKDAAYCSDAHRFAEAAEQQLAMQRLTDTQPALQRTQRMAAAKLDRPAAVETIGDGCTMTAKAGHLPFTPPVIEGCDQPRIPPEPLPRAATVLFLDREHHFRAGMPWSFSALAVPNAVAAPSPGSAAILNQLAQARIVIPRGLSSQACRKERWTAAPRTVLCAVVVPPVNWGKTFAPALTREPVLNPRWPPRPHRRRERELIPIVRLSGVPTPPAAPDMRRAPNLAALAPDASLSRIPLSRLTALAPPAPSPKDDSDEFWTILAASPLGAPLAVTHYPAVAPACAVPAGRSADGKTVIETRIPEQLPGWRSKLGRLSLAAGEIVLPLHPPDTALGQRHAATGIFAVEWPVAPRLPEWRAAPSRRSLHPLKIVLPVRPPGVALEPIALGSQSSPTAMEWVVVSQIPGWRVALPTLSLDLREIVLPVRPPAAAGGRQTAFWNGTCALAAIPHRMPAAPFDFKSSALIAPAGMPVPAPRIAGEQAKAICATHWNALAIAPCWPSSKMAGTGGGIAFAGRVDGDLRPDRADSERRPHSLQTLQTVLRLRFPRFSPHLAGRYGSAECIPLSPPSNRPIPWRAAVAGGTDLSPNQAFPARPLPAHALVLRQLPVRLYAVPRAKPMARPAGGKPLSLGMGLWASPPAIRACNLRFDDGKRRPRNVPTRFFGQDIRDRFSQDGVRSAWMKASRLPSDLKWIALVVPLILGIWILSRPMASEPAPLRVTESTPEISPVVEKDSQAAVTPVSAPPSVENKVAHRPGKTSLGEVPAAGPGRWNILTARIAGRASVNLVEDFRNGLSHWEGRGEWARSWSYDRSGTVRPGHMAIFQPTAGLRDYVFEMKASIERRAIQWMVRAAGPRNYHFARLNVTPGAPLTKLEFERWSVIDGRTGRVTRLPLPHGGANQTLYSIRVEVNGDSITTYLQDKVIDTFNDPRLPEGGVGLVGAPDDRPRIYGIHVFHQNDFLGKLCSFLVPPPINSQGSD